MQSFLSIKPRAMFTVRRPTSCYYHATTLSCTWTILVANKIIYSENLTDQKFFIVGYAQLFIKPSKTGTI